MENNQSSSNKKLLSEQNEKLIRKVDYDILTEESTSFPQKELLLEIQPKSSNHCKISQKVFVSIKPKTPTIKTLYIAENNRFDPNQLLEKSGTLFALGDHTSHTSFGGIKEESRRRTKNKSVKEYSVYQQVDNISSTSTCLITNVVVQKSNVFNSNQRSVQKCYFCTQPQIMMNSSKAEETVEEPKESPKKIDIATLIVTNTSSEDLIKSSSNVICKLSKRIDQLERKILKQEMVFRAIDPNIYVSSSDDDSNNTTMKTAAGKRQHRQNYIDQYSHVPETSAFHRYAHLPAPPPSKATNIEREHNSEQYGRNFTTYDGITARGRRHSASVPGRRCDGPKLAAERVHKMRHKLNPVRDYRLMDTVHYLAQGEFAPRDDGIKLTPSREAVLSDIIWEDVCRTHWPHARLARRGHHERLSTNTRTDLQRLIDNLLRERVAHVERRRRRHYRIIKLNQRHENCRQVGKTGDIIVASHKKKYSENNHDAKSDNGKALTTKKRKSNRSHDRLLLPVMRQNTHIEPEECLPGPSNEASHSKTKDPTYCYYTPSVSVRRNYTPKLLSDEVQEPSDSSIFSSKSSCNSRRLLVKKDSLVLPKRKTKDEPNLEHYILLPTLVVRTPSNLKRQNKFNELYHRILNLKLCKDEDCPVKTQSKERQTSQNSDKRDIGFNINITLSDSEEFIKTV